MDAKRILTYLRTLMANNNREWYWENKAEYDAVRADFEAGVQQALGRIAGFDSSIAHLRVKDCTYRFNRDTRFSADKSPYKNHLGAYMAAHGKKAMHGGYYLHLEPDHCMVACGNYWLPTNILTACRNEIMVNTDRWLECVENKSFQKYYGSKGVGSIQRPMDVSSWDQPKGFGIERLKTCPACFPRDWEHIEYLRMKDYCCWHHVSDDFFQGDKWLDDIVPMFKAAKPMMDFINDVIDDYE